jgi:hypothetical protein
MQMATPRGFHHLDRAVKESSLEKKLAAKILYFWRHLRRDGVLSPCKVGELPRGDPGGLGEDAGVSSGES